MRTLKRITLTSIAVLAGIGLVMAAKDPEVIPNVTGKWAGTWGLIDPETGEKAEKRAQLTLECEVVRDENGAWRATFEGECGRPYKYTIEMEGRQAGDAVLFKGTTDLGEEDGGVYDWIGRATGEQFIGFYTNPKYVGLFIMTREE
jgi:hypothetical protein